MHIERAHHIGQAAAIRKIDGFLDELMARPLPAGVKVKDARKTWDGGRMTFSVKASKGLMGATVSGTVEVSENAVVLDCALPMLLRTLVGEEKVRHVIDEQLEALLK